jgi:ATP-dependent RNA circularization protein (DNA/RNA ligase family)
MSKKLTNDEAKAKIYQLVKQLNEIEKEKRVVMTDFKDRINDVKAEMLAIIDEQEGNNTPGTSP